jgi:hypothetical protein
MASSVWGADRVIALEDEYWIPMLKQMVEGRAYIVNGPEAVVHVYSLAEGKKLHNIGRKGEGPGEFRWISHITVRDGKVTLSGSDKIIVYDRNGRILKETRVPYARARITPLGGHYAGFAYANIRQKSIRSLQILDSDFSTLKTLEEHITDRPYRGNNGRINAYIFQDFFHYKLMDDTIVVGNTQKGFHFGIFDKKGNKIRSIDLKHKKIPVTEEDKTNFMKIFKKTVGTTRYKRFQNTKNPLFPDHYPPYDYFDVSDQKIYVRLFPIVNNTQQLLVLDLKGNKLNQYTIPIHRVEAPFMIHNSHYCYLKENEDLEQWQLHMHLLE